MKINHHDIRLGPTPKLQYETTKIFFLFREASLFMGWGREITGGTNEIGRREKGGDKFWTTPEVGAKNFGLPPKGGAKNFRLDQFFQCS